MNGWADLEVRELVIIIEDMYGDDGDVNAVKVAISG